MRKYREPKVSLGIVLFISVIVLTIVVAAPIQMYLKLWGVAITEIILLAVAIVPAILFRWNVKEVFPIKLPQLRQVIGVFILWLATYLSVLTVTMIISYFFPSGLSQVNNVLLDLFRSVPFPIALFIIAFLPAVCEEALHRGLILTTFKNVKGKWTTIFAMAAIFGIFHLDFYRFLPTAILGFTLTYIMIETKNLLLPILFHFINNALSTSIAFSSSPQSDIPTTISTPLWVIGVWIIISAMVPFLALQGSKLLKAKRSNTIVSESAESDMEFISLEEERSKKNKRSILYYMPLLLIMVGFGITWFAPKIALNRIPVINMKFTMNEEQKVCSFDSIQVDKPGSYHLSYSFKGKGLIEMTLKSSEGEVLFNTKGIQVYENKTIFLNEGKYTLYYEYIENDGENPSTQVWTRIE